MPVYHPGLDFNGCPDLDALMGEEDLYLVGTPREKAEEDNDFAAACLFDRED